MCIWHEPFDNFDGKLLQAVFNFVKALICVSVESKSKTIIFWIRFVSYRLDPDPKKCIPEPFPWYQGSGRYFCSQPTCSVVFERE